MPKNLLGRTNAQKTLPLTRIDMIIVDNNWYDQIMLFALKIISPNCEKWWSRKITQKRNSIYLQRYRLFYQTTSRWDDSKYISHTF